MRFGRFVSHGVCLHSGVEPRHAEININAKGYTLIDLGSKQGTLVNAEPVQERLLRHEDVIQIGAARYVFREG